MKKKQLFLSLLLFLFDLQIYLQKGKRKFNDLLQVEQIIIFFTIY